MYTASAGEHALTRFKRLIPKSQDCTVILLKGHLLIEEQLRALVEALVEDPRALADARLTFQQWLCLGKAHIPGGAGDNLWKFVARLNQVRNKLAHSVEFADFDRNVDALIKFYAEDGFTHANTARDRASRLRTTLALVCGILNGTGQAFTELTKNKRELPIGCTG